VGVGGFFFFKEVDIFATVAYFICSGRSAGHIKFIHMLFNDDSTRIFIPSNGVLNLLKPNVNYSGRTAPLTSKVAFYIFIQQI